MQWRKLSGRETWHALGGRVRISLVEDEGRQVYRLYDSFEFVLDNLATWIGQEDHSTLASAMTEGERLAGFLSRIDPAEEIEALLGWEKNSE